MTEDASRRRFLKALGGTAALVSSAGCSGIEDLPVGGGAPENTRTPVDTPNGTQTPETEEDQNLEDDLDRLNKFKLNDRGFQSWNEVDQVLTVDGAGNIEAHTRIQDVTDAGGVHARYLQGAGAVDAFLADGAYRFGELFRTIMDGELENNSFNSLSLGALDHRGFGYGVRMDEGTTKKVYESIAGAPDQELDNKMRDLLIRSEDGRKMYFSPEDHDPGIYLEQGQRRHLSFGEERHLVQALEIKDDGVEVLVETGEEEITPLLEFGKPERVENRRLKAIYNPAGKYGRGIAVESLPLNCETLTKNIYTGDTGSFNHNDQEYSVEVETVLDNETVEVKNYSPNDSTSLDEIERGERYKFDENVSYTLDQVLPTDEDEGVAVISVEQC